MSVPSNQSKSKITKWLPAIALALLVHIAIVFVFISQSNSPDKTVDSKGASKIISNTNTVALDAQSRSLTGPQNQAQSSEQDLITSQSVEPLSTITSDEPASSNTNQAPSIPGNRASNNTANTSALSLDEQIRRAGDAPDLPNDASELPIPDNALITNSSPSMDMPIENATTTPLTKRVFIKNGEVSNRDDLLLGREQTTRNEPTEIKQEYERISEEADAINEQLSQTINQVKEENQRRIEAAQRQQAMTYQHNNQTLSQKIDEDSRKLDLGRVAEEEFAVSTDE